MVKKAKMYCVQDLIAQHNAKMATVDANVASKAAATAENEATKVAHAAQKVEKVAQRALRVCRVFQKRTHRGGAGWCVCRCGSFLVCPVCMKMETGRVVAGAHATECADTG